MPTPVILYIFTFLFIFPWPFGVNILESFCLLLSNLVLYFWDELNISKKVTEIQSTLIHYDNYNIYIYCPSRGLLGYPQPWRCHQLPPWPGAVFCYALFTKKYLSLSGPCQPHRQICRGGSWGTPHPPPEWWRLKKSWLSYHRISPAHTFCRHCLGPTGDLFVLIWQPCVEKVLYKYNDMFFFSREIWYKKSLTYVFIFTTQLAGTEFSQGRSRGRWRERGIVHWFGACELVWYLEIMCIFSHESIEKSLPNSRGDVNAEDGEVIVDSKSFSTQNAQEGY